MPTDPDAPGNEPNLELPSFGFGRRKKRGRKSEERSAESAPSDEAAETDLPAGDAGTDASEQAVGRIDDEGSTARPAGAAPARPTTPRAPAAPPAPARAPGGAPAPARPAARPPARPPARPAATAGPVSPVEPPNAPRSAAARPAQEPPPAPPADTESLVPVPVVEPEAPFLETMHSGSAGLDELEPTAVDPLDHAAAALDASQEARARRRAERSDARARRRAAKADRKRKPAGDALVAHLPRINPVVAALLTGAVAGLATVLLAFGAARGCQAVRGTDSCGGGAGLLAVVGILAIEVLLGAALLKAWRIADPFSTSFLGVGVVATIAMLVFLDQINSPWMLLVIPLMTAVAFALSWWVTVRVIDETPMSAEADSERGEPAFRERADAEQEDPQDEGSRA